MMRILVRKLIIGDKKYRKGKRTNIDLLEVFHHHMIFSSKETIFHNSRTENILKCLEMAEMSRKGRLSLRRPSRPSGEDRRETETFPSTRTSCHISQELESPAGYELSVPRSIFHEKKSSPLHGRALLFSYEEVHSQQSCEANFVLSSGSPIPIALHDSKHKFQIQIPPIRRTHEGDENLVDTPPDSPRIEKDESWACSACTFLNKLISEW